MKSKDVLQPWDAARPPIFAADVGSLGSPVLCSQFAQHPHRLNISKESMKHIASLEIHPCRSKTAFHRAQFPAPPRISSRSIDYTGTSQTRCCPGRRPADNQSSLGATYLFFFPARLAPGSGLHLLFAILDEVGATLENIILFCTIDF